MNKFKQILISILVIATLIGCSEYQEDNKIVNPEEYKNTPPILKGINLPSEVSIYDDVPIIVDIYDKDHDYIQMLWTYDIQTAYGVKTKEKLCPIGGNGYIKVPQYAHSITVTLTAYDIKLVNNTGTDPGWIPLHAPIQAKATTIVREANTIIPGKRMGDIIIGSNINDLKNKLSGRWSNMPRRPNGFIYNDGKYNVYGYTNSNEIIILAAIEWQKQSTTPTGRYRTPGGNGNVSGSRKVIREFGTTNDIRYGPTHVYGERGISFAYRHGIKLANGVAVFNQEGLRQLTTPIVPEDMHGVTIIR